MSFDLDAGQIRQLLDELDQRLSAVGIAATVYVVGGAAISLHLPDTDRRTQDIDGITTDDRVADIVAQMADELGLPEGWLNGAARPFLPPIPADALAPPSSKTVGHSSSKPRRPTNGLRCSARDPLQRLTTGGGAHDHRSPAVQIDPHEL